MCNPFLRPRRLTGLALAVWLSTSWAAAGEEVPGEDATARLGRALVAEARTDAPQAVDALRQQFAARQAKVLPSSTLLAQKGKNNWGNIGGGILQGLMEGAAQQQQQQNKNSWGKKNKQHNKPWGWDDGYDDDDYYYEPHHHHSNNYNNNYNNGYGNNNVKPAEAPKPKPKPTSQGPFTVQEYHPNRLASAPVLPSSNLRSAFAKEIDGVIAGQLETIDNVLRVARITDVATRSLLNRAKRSAGSGFDAELVSELSRAIFAKDATKVDEVGMALSLPADQLEVAVLATYHAQLNRLMDEAEDPADHRLTQDVRKCATRFQKRLRHAGRLDKSLRDGLIDRLDAVQALLDARQELAQSAGDKPASAADLTWPEGEVWVLATPDVKPGTVYYVTSHLVVAGTKVEGPLTVLKSTVASAFGCQSFEGAPSGRGVTATVSPDKYVTILNPPASTGNFAFQINGHDYSLKPGTMYWFTYSDDRKLESFRYSSDGGENNAGFDLKEADGTPIKEACFVMTQSGNAWKCTRPTRVPYVSLTAAKIVLPATYLANETDRPIKVTFDRGEHLLPPGGGIPFDQVSDWRIRFASTKPSTPDQPKAGERSYTLAGGRSFRLVMDDAGIDLKGRPADVVEVDNSQSAVAFSYRLGDEWHTLPPFERKEHRFATPPTNLVLSYDQGNGTLASFTAQLGQTYQVGLQPSLLFAIAPDPQVIAPTLDVARADYVAREGRLVSLAEELADKLLAEQAQQAEAAVAEPGPPVATPTPVPAERERERERPQRLPTAHVLSIGVSQYANDKFNLKYCDRDATEFSKRFDESTQGLFGDVFSDVLVNERATKRGIEKALNRLSKTVDEGDLAVLFFSAHGQSDIDRYYLCPHDFDPNDLVSTTVKYSDILDTVRTLNRLDCQVIILADTCYSATLASSLGAKSTSSGTLLEAHEGALGEMPKNTGGCLLLASSSANAESFERDEWRHSAFTKALLDVIEDPASDQDADGLLFAGELEQALRRQLLKLTNNEQRSQSSWPESSKDFPLLRSAR